MTAALREGGMTVIEDEPDPQAVGALQQMMEDFTPRAPAAAAENLRNRMIVTTMNDPGDTGFLPGALQERFKPIVMRPLGEPELKKIFQVTMGKLLDKKGLTTRQRSVAEDFIAASVPDYQPGMGARGLTKHVAQLLGGAAFTELMDEFSPGGMQRNFEKAIKGSRKNNLHAPPTARFKRGRKP